MGVQVEHELVSASGDSSRRMLIVIAAVSVAILLEGTVTTTSNENAEDSCSVSISCLLIWDLVVWDITCF